MIFVIIFLLISLKNTAAKVEKAAGDKKVEEEVLKKEVEESVFVMVVAIFASLWMGQIQAVSNIAFILMIYNLVHACCI